MDGYTIGWICAILPELTAARLHLDKEHDVRYDRQPGDDNAYVFGDIGGHNIIIATLPRGEYGTNSAAVVARDMIRSFPDLKLMLMVGIGGGVPVIDRHVLKRDIRLGDVVVGIPEGGTGGVIQLDFGKAMSGSFRRTGHLNQPPRLLLTAANALISDLELHGHHIDGDIKSMTSDPRFKAYSRPSDDLLFESSYLHTSASSTCTDCQQSRLIRRIPRNEQPLIHYGLIGSSNTVIKDSALRDALGDEDILCVEMEAAGLMNNFPVLVIRGICDYADSHKNKAWQGYAAMTAAAFAKLLLKRVPHDISRERRLRDILSIGEQVDKSIRVQQEHLDFVRSQHFQTIDKAISDWLSAVDPALTYDKAMRKRQLGTGQWLIDDGDFARWRRGDVDLLCLTGRTGCGKTILSSTIIQHLKATKSPEQSVLYWYFTFDDARQQTLVDLHRSCINQLCQQTTSSEPLQALYKSCGNGHRQATARELEECFAKLCENSSVMLVIDALDESTTRNDVLMWTLNATKQSARIMITTRPDRRVTDELQGPNARVKSISRDAISVDISIFVHAMVYEHSAMQRWRNRPDIQGMIERSILEKADGSFRWTASQLNTLSACYQESRLREALQRLPSDLNDTYHQQLGSVARSHQDEVAMTLRLLLYAAEPLTLDAIIDAIAIKDGKFYPQDRLVDPTELEIICAGLVSIDPAQQTDPRQYARLTHLSVREFLLSGHVVGFMRDQVSPAMTHRDIAAACLAYIPDKEPTQDLPFLTYATRFWIHHFKMMPRPSGLVDLIVKFLVERPTAFKVWLSYVHETDLLPQKDHCPVAIAVQNGLSILLVTLIDKTDNDHDMHECQALAIAASKNDEVCVRLLLQGGFSVHEEHMDTALAHGSLEIVRLLSSDYAADEHTIEMVFQFGRLDVLKDLFKPGDALVAEVASRSSEWTAAMIKSAAQGGHFEIVQYVLESGWKPSQDALVAAAIRDDAKLVRFLLKNGLCPDQAAIEAAVEAGADSALRLLLAPHAEMIRCLSRQMRAACLAGHVDIVEALVQNGVEPLEKDLLTAVAAGQLLVVQKLLDIGIRPTATHLAKAAGNGDEEIFEALCGAGAEPTQSALDAAIDQGHVDMVRLLLARGLSWNQYGVQKALEAEDFEIIKLLLKRGLPPRQEILDLALLKGDVRVATQMINAGLRCANDDALMLAVRSGCVDVVKLCIDKMEELGCLSVSDDVLCEAVVEEHETIVVHLLDKGLASPSVPAFYHAVAMGNVSIIDILCMNKRCTTSMLEHAIERCAVADQAMIDGEALHALKTFYSTYHIAGPHDVQAVRQAVSRTAAARKPDSDRQATREALIDRLFPPPPDTANSKAHHKEPASDRTNVFRAWQRMKDAEHHQRTSPDNRLSPDHGVSYGSAPVRPKQYSNDP